MSRPIVITLDVIRFIRDNMDEMPPRLLAKELNLPLSTIRNYMSREGICCMRKREKRTAKEYADFGYFNVNERVDWLTGLQP